MTSLCLLSKDHLQKNANFREIRQYNNALLAQMIMIQSNEFTSIIINSTVLRKLVYMIKLCSSWKNYAFLLQQMYKSDPIQGLIKNEYFLDSYDTKSRSSTFGNDMRREVIIIFLATGSTSFRRWCVDGFVCNGACKKKQQTRQVIRSDQGFLR